MKKELHLHIGTHKTGTTSLQVFLDKNSEVLKENGFYFPKSGWYHHSQHELAFSLQKNNCTYPLINHPIWKELKDELSRCEADKVIISSEEFSNISEESIKALQTFFNDFHVYIYIYIRRQSDMFESMYNQQTKDWNSSRKEPIEVLLKTHNKVCNYLNYDYLISKWENVFMQENITVRIYDKAELINNNTIDDFLTLVGLKSLKNDTIIKKVNQSISSKALEIIRLSKHISITPEERKKLFIIATEYFPYKNKNNRLLSKKESLLIDAKYKLSNENIRKKYFNTKNTLFSESYEETDRNTLNRLDMLKLLVDLLKEKGI